MAPLLMFIGLIGLSATAATAEIEFNEPNVEEAPPAASFNGARARMRELEEQIAARLARLRGEGQYNAMATNADINVRVIARRLLSVGAEAGRPGAVATLYGYTLANQADAIEGELRKLPLRVTAVKAAENPTDDELRIAAGFADAVAKFNEVAEREAQSLTDASPMAVDRYLARLTGALEAVRKAAAQEAGKAGADDEPATTWVASPATAALATPAAPPRVTEERIADLERRVRAAPVPRQTKDELTAMIDLMRRGADRPELRARVADFAALMDLAVTIGEGLGVIEWLDASLAGEFRDGLGTAVLLMKDPRTRDAGYQRLVSMGATLRLGARVKRLADVAVPTGPIAALVRKWYAMHHGGQDPATSGELYDYLDRLTDAMSRYRELLGAADLPVDLRRVALDLRSEYQQQELALLGALPRLGDELDTIGEARWADALNELVTRVNRLNRVHQLPRWIAALERHKPRPANGVARRLRELALALNDPQKAAAADASLRSLEDGVWLLSSLTYEGRLREPDDAIARITGSLDVLLVGQIDRLRQDWATAWASGGNTGAAADRLLMMDRLGRLIRVTDAIGGIERAAGRLNGWAAWETPATVVTPLARTLPDGVREACRLASIGNWAALEPMMERIEREAPLPLLVAQLAYRVGDRIGEREAGLASVVAQLQPPEPGAFGREQRLTLAQLSAELTEAAHERATGRADRAEALLAYLGRVAMEVLERVDEADAKAGRAVK